MRGGLVLAAASVVVGGVSWAIREENRAVRLFGMHEYERGRHDQAQESALLLAGSKPGAQRPVAGLCPNGCGTWLVATVAGWVMCIHDDCPDPCAASAALGGVADQPWGLTDAPGSERAAGAKS